MAFAGGPTVSDVIETLTEVVNEFGEDYIYPTEWIYIGDGGCQYIREGDPSCIAGQCFYRWGVSDEVLSRFEGMSCDHVYGSLYGKNSNNAAANTLRTAQMTQDSGDSWGLALERARAYAAETSGVR